jgi:pimeloyl-ACP methyl ester carboxylesterase
MSSDDTIPGVSESTQWEKVGRAWLRILRFSPVGPADGTRHGTALLVPGLGLPRYLLPLARLQAAQGVETVVLDALAWRGRGQRATPTIAGLAEVTAAWLQRREPDPLVVMGHSTGSQVALETVLRIQGTRGDLALVMAGPTFQPGQRSLRGLIPAQAQEPLRRDCEARTCDVGEPSRVRGHHSEHDRGQERAEPRHHVVHQEGQQGRDSAQGKTGHHRQPGPRNRPIAGRALQDGLGVGGHDHTIHHFRDGH